MKIKDWFGADCVCFKKSQNMTSKNDDSVMANGSIDADFGAVTNQISVDVEDNQFVRLVIEEQ